MLKPLALSLALALAAVAPAALAQAPAPKAAAAAPTATEARIAEAVEKLVGRKVESVTKAPFLGLYEVYMGGDILYTDEKVNYLLVGDVYDAKSAQPRNLKEERLAKLNAVKFADLPLDQAFKIVKGSGKRQLAYFSDPNCPYCKRIEKEFASLNDVTVHVFMYPILSADSAAKSKAVWCAPDRAKAWNDLMMNGVEPKAGATCDTPIEKNLALGQKYRITGTPTLIFENGTRLPGAAPADKINQLLADASKK
ncbi:MAG: DsbC family protein [Burkholderiales bacterium]|jgi:thiol:disulfide interchange protein DsbC|nr:DsbC family protein [Burkholderiales bacterium]